MEGLSNPALKDLTDPGTAEPAHDHQLFLKILFLVTVFKLSMALAIPIALDESYAVAVAREYSLSFFDHPPVSFWLPVLAADLTGIETTFMFRLPFLLIGTLTVWLIYQIGREIGGNRVGAWAALLYAASPFFLLSSGVFVVPDVPLNAASAVVVLCLVRIAKAPEALHLDKWLIAGVAMSVALASKYQAAWLPVGVLVFVILHAPARHWFLRPGPYLAGVIGLLGLVPVLLWNADHDWVTFRFHTDRVSGGLHPGNLLGMGLVQGVFLLPATLVAAVAGLWLVLRRRAIGPLLMLGLLAIGPILFFNYVNLASAKSHAHWSMPGWIFALPLAALWLTECGPKALRRVWAWTFGALAVIWALLLILLLQSTTGVLTRPFYERAPDWDNTLSLFSFKDLRKGLEARGLWDETDVFMANSWAFGGILDTALGGEKPMRIFDEVAAHHFIYLSDATATGRTLFMEPAILRDAAGRDALTLATARKIDPEAELLPPLILTRGGQPYVSVTLVRLTLR